MTINNKDAYFASLWDWGILDDCFGGKIKPTDLDGFVERKGRFLVLETKLPNVPLTTGQEITFEALRKTTLFTIFVIWGHPGTPERLQLYSRHRVEDAIDCDLDTLRRYCKRWFEFADGGY